MSIKFISRPTRIARGLWGLNPLAQLIEATPLALVNSNPLGVGGGLPQPPSSLAMNGLLLIITRPPSTIHYASHVYGFLTAFGYCEFF